MVVGSFDFSLAGVTTEAQPTPDQSFRTKTLAKPRDFNYLFKRIHNKYFWFIHRYEDFPIFSVDTSRVLQHQAERKVRTEYLNQDRGSYLWVEKLEGNHLDVLDS